MSSSPVTKSRILATDYMQTLKKQLIDIRGIAESSANLYINNLWLINERQSFHNLGFLKKGLKDNKITDYLSQYAENTQCSKLTAIVSALSTVKDNHLYKTTYKTFSEMLNEKLGIKEEVVTEDKTKAQEDNWVEWKDVLEKLAEIKMKVDEFKNEKVITNKQFEIVIDYLVLSLYSLQAPRRNGDFLNMYILLKAGDETSDKTRNYADMINHKFIYNVYKTAKHHGQEVVDMKESLIEVLNLWIKYHPQLQGAGKNISMVKLFVNREGVPQNGVNFVTLRLNKLFKKKIGSSMLRHIFISHTFESVYSPEVQAKQAEIAKEMGHSVAEQKRYYKAPTKEVKESKSDDVNFVI